MTEVTDPKLVEVVAQMKAQMRHFAAKAQARREIERQALSELIALAQARKESLP